jgi:hypothetical protein
MNSGPPAPTDCHAASRRARFWAGVVAGALVPLALAEVAVRMKPPDDLQLFLGAESSVAGIYRPDPVLRVAYRSVEEYQPFEAPKLKEIQPLNTEQPTWIFFGNSFARGLSASMRERMKEHRILFFRESKDELHMRVAQLRLILEHGLKPDRAFFTLIPSEVAHYVQRPLDWVGVSPHGGLTSDFNRPGEPLNTLLDHSRLVRLAWVRSKLRFADPTFSTVSITERVPEGTVADFRRMFGALGELSRKHGVPITVVILPERRQILGKSSCGLQSALAPLVKEAGLDAFDPKEAFLAYPEKMKMYLPDWHYSPVGDDILLDALLAHLKHPNPKHDKGGAVP